LVGNSTGQQINRFRNSFTRKSSGSAIAAKAFMNNAGNPPGQLPEADLVLPNVEGVRPESIEP